MSKYIDADKFIKKFEKMIDDIPASVDSGAGYVIDEVYKIFDSLQQEQPEVELEKEYKTWWNSISGKINIEHIMEWYMHETARHFYELGLKARKEE